MPSRILQGFRSWERLKAGGEGDDRGWDGWMASPTQWTWVWVNSRSWWWAGSPGVLQSMSSQRVGHEWATEQQQKLLNQFSSVQSLSCVRLFATPWTAACQTSLSITNSQSLLKLMSIKRMMPSNHLILCHPLLLPPSIFPRIRVFSNESVHSIRWPKYWSFSLRISPSNEYSGEIFFRIDWFDLRAIRVILKSIL